MDLYYADPKAKPRVIEGRKATFACPNAIRHVGVLACMYVCYLWWALRRAGTGPIPYGIGWPGCHKRDPENRVFHSFHGSGTRFFLFWMRALTRKARSNTEKVWKEAMEDPNSASADSLAESPEPLSARREIKEVSSREALKKKIQGLTVQLAIATEACKRAEKGLGESEERYRSLVETSSSVIRELQDQLQRVQRMSDLGGVLAPAMAHDVANLLTVINSQTQICLQKRNLSRSIKENIQIISEVTKKAITLNTTFVEFVRLVKFDQLEQSRVNVNELVIRVWKTAMPNDPHHRITFETRLQKNLPEVMGDSEKLERVFLNIFLNAIQALPQKGKIVVKTLFLRSKDSVEINVMDNGPGIPKRYLTRIFEPFFTTREGGTGLGLSICRAIVEQHQGYIAIDSDGRRGTQVSVRLPLKPKTL